MKELMLSLMVWASAHTGLPVPERMPEVQHLSRCAVQAIVRPEAECNPDAGAVAAYDHRIGRVYLPENWSARDLYQVSILLHELVHHMQAESGLVMTPDNPCPGRNLEKPAYEAQMAWLGAAGVDPFEVMRINRLFYTFVISCPRDW